jgi:hypothetical protein
MWEAEEMLPAYRCPRVVSGSIMGVLGLASALISPAHGQVTQVTSRPGGDTVVWCQLNFPPGATFPTPVHFASYGGIEGKAIVDKEGSGELQEQCCAGINGLFDGNFSPGDMLFLTTSSAPLAISFEKPVKSVGAQIGFNTYGPFIAQIQAYDHNRLLGSFNETGNETSSADNSAIFLGVADAKAEITKVVYTVTNSTGTPGVFAINQANVSQ